MVSLTSLTTLALFTQALPGPQGASDIATTGGQLPVPEALTSVATDIMFVPLASIGTQLLHKILNDIAIGLLNLTFNVLFLVVEKWLFFPNPYTIPGLNELWNRMLFLFLPILVLQALVFLVMLQMTPNSTKLDPWRFMLRALQAFCILLLSQVGLGLAVETTHTLSHFFFPQDFAFQTAEGTVEEFIASIDGSALAVLAGLYAVYLIGFSSVFLIVFVLAIRAFLMYAVYGLFPVLIALWVGDYGPVKYGHQVAASAFQATALLLVVGLLISAVLAVGAAIASSESASQGGFVADDPTVGTSHPSGTSGGLGPTLGLPTFAPETESRLAPESRSRVPLSDDTPGGTAQDAGEERSWLLLRILSLFGSMMVAGSLGMAALTVMISVGGMASLGNQMRARGAEHTHTQQTAAGGAGGGGTPAGTGTTDDGLVAPKNQYGEQTLQAHQRADHDSHLGAYNPQETAPSDVPLHKQVASAGVGMGRALKNSPRAVGGMLQTDDGSQPDPDNVAVTDAVSESIANSTAATIDRVTDADMNTDRLRGQLRSAVTPVVADRHQTETDEGVPPHQADAISGAIRGADDTESFRRTQAAAGTMASAGSRIRASARKARLTAKRGPQHLRENPIIDRNQSASVDQLRRLDASFVDGSMDSLVSDSVDADDVPWFLNPENAQNWQPAATETQMAPYFADPSSDTPEAALEDVYRGGMPAGMPNVLVGRQTSDIAGRVVVGDAVNRQLFGHADAKAPGALYDSDREVLTVQDQRGTPVGELVPDSAQPDTPFYALSDADVGKRNGADVLDSLDPDHDVDGPIDSTMEEVASEYAEVASWDVDTDADVDRNAFLDQSAGMLLSGNTAGPEGLGVTSDGDVVTQDTTQVGEAFSPTDLATGAAAFAAYGAALGLDVSAHDVAKRLQQVSSENYKEYIDSIVSDIAHDDGGIAGPEADAIGANIKRNMWYAKNAFHGDESFTDASLLPTLQDERPPHEILHPDSALGWKTVNADQTNPEYLESDGAVFHGKMPGNRPDLRFGKTTRDTGHRAMVANVTGQLLGTDRDPRAVYYDASTEHLIQQHIEAEDLTSYPAPDDEVASRNPDGRIETDHGTKPALDRDAYLDTAATVLVTGNHRGPDAIGVTDSGETVVQDMSTAGNRVPMDAAERMAENLAAYGQRGGVDVDADDVLAHTAEVVEEAEDDFHDKVSNYVNARLEEETSMSDRPAEKKVAKVQSNARDFSDWAQSRRTTHSSDDTGVADDDAGTDAGGFLEPFDDPDDDDDDASRTR